MSEEVPVRLTRALRRRLDSIDSEARASPDMFSQLTPSKSNLNSIDEDRPLPSNGPLSSIMEQASTSVSSPRRGRITRRSIRESSVDNVPTPIKNKSVVLGEINTQPTIRITRLRTREMNRASSVDITDESNDVNDKTPEKLISPKKEILSDVSMETSSDGNRSLESGKKQSSRKSTSPIKPSLANNIKDKSNSPMEVELQEEPEKTTVKKTPRKSLSAEAAKQSYYFNTSGNLSSENKSQIGEVTETNEKSMYDKEDSRKVVEKEIEEDLDNVICNSQPSQNSSIKSKSARSSWAGNSSDFMTISNRNRNISANNTPFKNAGVSSLINNIENPDIDVNTSNMDQSKSSVMNKSLNKSVNNDNSQSNEPMGISVINESMVSGKSVIKDISLSSENSSHYTPNKTSDSCDLINFSQNSATKKEKCPKSSISRTTVTKTSYKVSKSGSMNKSVDISITQNDEPEKNNRRKSDIFFAGSWTQSTKIRPAGAYIDGYGINDPNKKLPEVIKAVEKKKPSRIDSSSENDEEYEKNSIIDDEAMEVDEDYDSRSEDERREIEENQIEDRGEYIGSDDTDEEDIEAEEELYDDSFVVEDHEIVNDLLNGSGDDLSMVSNNENDPSAVLSDSNKVNLSSKQKKVQHIIESDNSDVESVECLNQSIKSSGSDKNRSSVTDDTNEMSSNTENKDTESEVQTIKTTKMSKKKLTKDVDTTLDADSNILQKMENTSDSSDVTNESKILKACEKILAQKQLEKREERERNKQIDLEKMEKRKAKKELKRQIKEKKEADMKIREARRLERLEQMNSQINVVPKSETDEAVAKKLKKKSKLQVNEEEKQDEMKKKKKKRKKKNSVDETLKVTSSGLSTISKFAELQMSSQLQGDHELQKKKSKLKSDISQKQSASSTKPIILKQKDKKMVKKSKNKDMGKENNKPISPCQRPNQHGFNESIVLPKVDKFGLKSTLTSQPHANSTKRKRYQNPETTREFFPGSGWWDVTPITPEPAIPNVFVFSGTSSIASQPPNKKFKKHSSNESNATTSSTIRAMEFKHKALYRSNRRENQKEAIKRKAKFHKGL